MTKKEQLLTQAAALLDVTPAKLANTIGVNYLSRKTRGMVQVVQKQHQALDRLNNYLISQGYEISIIPIAARAKEAQNQSIEDYWQQTLTNAN